MQVEIDTRVIGLMARLTVLVCLVTLTETDTKETGKMEKCTALVISYVIYF